MRPPRIQFTIRRLIVLIALCGLFFAALRTPFGFLAVYALAALPGFLIGRARGGSGIVAGALSESAFIASVTIYLFWSEVPNAPKFTTLADTIFGILILTTLAIGFAFVFGLLVSGVLYLLFEVPGLFFQRPGQDKFFHFDEIRWLTPDERPSQS